MSDNRFDGVGIKPGTVPASALTPTAYQTILANKLVALRTLAANFSFNANNPAAVVTSTVLAAASTDTPTADFSAKGIFTGSIGGANDSKRVLIRNGSTDNSISDGIGDEIYGVLSESTGVYTLTLKKSDGTDFQFASATLLDFYFVEVFDEYTKPTDALIRAQASTGGSGGSSESQQLQVTEGGVDKRKLTVSSSDEVLTNGQTVIQEMNALVLQFDGATVNFATGVVLAADDSTPLGANFTPPSIANGMYRWASITLIPDSVVPATNRIKAKLLVLFGSADGVSPAVAPRAGFSVGKPLCQIILKGNSGHVSGIDPILQVDIEKLKTGSGGSSQIDPVREVPTGAVDGINTDFVCSIPPVAPAALIVILDGDFVGLSKYSLAVDTISFTTAPAPGQKVEVFYFPDPIAALTGGGGGGGAFDPANIAGNLTPDTDGARKLGTTLKGWDELILKDKTTGVKWRIFVDNGILDSESVP